jgi:hypothetical protein
VTSPSGSFFINDHVSILDKFVKLMPLMANSSSPPHSPPFFSASPPETALS